MTNPADQPHAAPEGDTPPASRDALTLGFLAVVAVLTLAGIALAVSAWIDHRSQPDARATGASATSRGDVLASLKSAADRLIADLRAPEPARASKTPDAQALPPAPGQTKSKPKPAVKSANYADPKRTFSAVAAPNGRQVLPPPANGNWTYDVYFGPNWGKAGQLAFQTQTQDKGGTGASMAWSPNSGAPKVWFLGVVEPDHPTHANTRFPGFFMHPAYFPQALVPGSRLLWEFPWQGSDGKTRAERVRRFDMKVIAWERVSVAAGEFDAAHLEGTLRYMEGETIRAEVRYGLWYAPRAMQSVRVLWEGRAPDESQAEMIAELAFQRAP